MKKHSSFKIVIFLTLVVIVTVFLIRFQVEIVDNNEESRSLEGKLIVAYKNGVYEINPNDLNKKLIIKYKNSEINFPYYEKSRNIVLFIATTKDENNNYIDELILNENGKNKILFKSNRKHTNLKQTSFENPSLEFPIYLPNQKVLFIKVDKINEDNYKGSLYQLDINTNEVKLLVEDLDDSSYYSYSENNNKILFVKDSKIYIYSLKDGLIQAITKGKKPVWISVNKFLYQQDSYISIYDLSTGSKRKVKKAEILGVPVISSDKKFIAYKTMLREFGVLRENIIINSLNDNWFKVIDLYSVFEYYPYTFQWVNE